ncbi:MAG: dTDP-4-dehydrorhamnose 3,5-epimerase family protein [Thermoguttaceae bacterium]
MNRQGTAFSDGAIEGVLVRRLVRLEDPRGWLAELYREDQLPPEQHPVMAYVSQTLPGVTRGPHEHREQTDCFAFLGPGDFRLWLWDARPNAATFGNRLSLVAGESNPQIVIVPPGVVHAYKNISQVAGLVFNCPNRLYAGPGKAGPVDEIRHEDLPDSPFVME